MERNIEVYIFHAIDDVVISLFREDRLLSMKEIKKRELGENLIESFQALLEKENLTLENVESLYLNSSFSTWNASRLVTLFAKTLITFTNIKLFLMQESLDQEDIVASLKSFVKHKKNFKLIDKLELLEPLYKKCPHINI